MKELVSFVDIFLSLCDWTDAPAPQGLAGHSLDALIHGEHPDDQRGVFSELYGGFPRVSVVARMVRKGPWEYNFYQKEPPELFNLEKDPSEWHNLSHDPDYHDVCQELETQVLEGWDPEDILSRLREHQERFQYFRKWTEAVNPPDPDQWDGSKPPFPDEWRQNTLSLPEYIHWKREREKDAVTSWR